MENHQSDDVSNIGVVNDNDDVKMIMAMLTDSMAIMILRKSIVFSACL